jgi:polyhydroxyalkanoate synthase subunit PhaC
MSANPSPSDSSAYFESLLHVGQQSMKQFDDALATTLGVDGKLSTSEVTSPFSFAMNMQRQYWTLIWRFWNATFVKAFAPGADSNIQPARGDRCFQDKAWRQAPYYDLLKQSGESTATTPAQ